MIVKTRAQLRSLVTRRARIVDHLNAHPVADVNLDLDDAYREMRFFCTDKKWGTFLVTTGALTLPTTPATAGENFVAIPVPTTSALVKRLETRYSTEWKPAEEIPLGQLRMYNVETNSGTRGPWAWCLLDAGVQATELLNTGVAAQGLIALTPLPTSGVYQLWYLPEFAGTSADSGANGFYSYANDNQLQLHVYLACEKVTISDNDSQGMMAGVRAKVLDYKQAIIETAPTAAGPRTLRRSRFY